MSVQVPSAAIHQVVSTLEVDDAVGNEVRLIAERLRRRGYSSEIFTVLQRGNEPAPVRDIAELLEGPVPVLVLYHFATASPATRVLASGSLPLALVYHNVTPEHFFWGFDRDHFDSCRGAAEDVGRLAGRVRLALAHSEYSRRDLAAAGFPSTAAFPLLLDTDSFSTELSKTELAQHGGAAPVLLTVGRIAPNKCIEDCIRLLAAVRQEAAPHARLWIAGDGSRMRPYVEGLRHLSQRLGVEGAVEWLGRVPRDELVQRYRRATLYVSMSEHEGFGGPLVEAMLAGLPVLAYDAAAVGETLGGAGILLPDKRMTVAAEAVSLLLRDGAARRRLVEAGRRRAAQLDSDSAFAALLDRLKPLLAGVSP
jgi:L-malate glycosyltransferase